jgi:hypothetical protein
MMDIVDKLVQSINKGDIQGLSVLASDDCMVSFEDMPDIPWAEYVEAYKDLMASFPDFSISGFIRQQD